MKSRSIPAILLFCLLTSAIPIKLQPSSLPQQTREEQPYGGTLRVGIISGVLGTGDNLNPIINHNIVYSTNLGANIFSSLLRRDENDSLVSDLAKNWSMSVDCLDYFVHLYDNITWHDGVSFNASDVKFTFDTILTNPDIDQYWNLSGHPTVDLAAVEIINETYMQFHLNEVCSYFLDVVTKIPMLPKHLYDGTDLITNPYNDNPVGTGPFRFVEWSPNTNLTLEANELYFRGRPHIDTVIARWDIPLLDLTECLRNNTLDIVPCSIDPNRIDELSIVPGITLTSSIENRFFLIGINHNNEILGNVEVRRAIAHLVNKSELCEKAYLNYAVPAVGPFSSSFSLYNSGLADYEFNTTRAEEILDAAGYTEDENGTRFIISMKVFDNEPYLVNATEMMTASMQEAGINVTRLVLPPWQIINDLLNESRPFELVAISLDIWPYNGQPSIWHTLGDWNWWNFSNTQIDSLLDQIHSTIDLIEKTSLFSQLQELLVSELPAVFLYHKKRTTGFSNDFHGFVEGLEAYTIGPYSLEHVWYEPTLSGEGNCPYRVCFVDSEGRRTGYFDGVMYGDIPNSTYTGMDSDPQLVKIRRPSGTFTIELAGIENDSYSFEFVNIALDYKNVRIKEGYIHENETITYVLRVYPDGTIKAYDPDTFSPNDIGIAGFTSKSVVGQGFNSNITLGVFNYGDYQETFNVTVYVNATEIGTQIVENMPNGTSTNLGFAWNTTDFGKGNYTVNTVLDTVPGEIDTTDNTCNATVYVGIPGDVNADHYVGIDDIFHIASYFGSETGQPNYESVCDITDDGYIGIDDIFIAASHFGEEA